MTKKLEELFDLPETEQEKVDLSTTEITQQEIQEAVELTTLEKVEAALTAVRGLENDSEMDTIAQQAVDSFQELMNLGMNVEPRHAAEIFGVAERMLSTALSAKDKKITKKLKMLDLQLKKAKLDMEQGQDGPKGSSGMLMDRNELLKQLTQGVDSVIDAEETDE